MLKDAVKIQINLKKNSFSITPFYEDGFIGLIITQIEDLNSICKILQLLFTEFGFEIVSDKIFQTENEIDLIFKRK